MILLGLFRFIGFVSGILLTLIVIGLLLRTRTRREENEIQSMRERNRELRSENAELKREAFRLTSELERQKAEFEEMRRRTSASSERRGTPS